MFQYAAPLKTPYSLTYEETKYKWQIKHTLANGAVCQFSVTPSSIITTTRGRRHGASNTRMLPGWRVLIKCWCVYFTDWTTTGIVLTQAHHGQWQTNYTTNSRTGTKVATLWATHMTNFLATSHHYHGNQHAKLLCQAANNIDKEYATDTQQKSYKGLQLHNYRCTNEWQKGLHRHEFPAEERCHRPRRRHPEWVLD